MKKYALTIILFPLLFCAAFGQIAEKLSPEGTSYFDPEIHNEAGLLCYQISNGDIWLGELNPLNGLFMNLYGMDEEIGDDGVPLIETFNGPEFGWDSTSWFICYTKEIDGINQIWQIKKEDKEFISQQVTFGQVPRQTALAAKNLGSDSERIVYTIGGFQGLMAWKDLSNLQEEVVIDSVDRGIRWIDNSNSLAYIKQTGENQGEIAIYNTDTRTEEIISSDGRHKSNPYGWFAPEYDNQLLVATLIDNDQRIAVYKKNNNIWEIIREIETPQNSAYNYFGSPEPFIAAGKSYISCVVKEEERAYSNSEVWIFSLSEGNTTNLQLKISDGLGEIIRTDPETYIGKNEVFVYYNVIENDNTFQIYRARTGLETLNSGNISCHIVKPSETDTNINGLNEPHYVLTNNSIEKLNKLLVYFPGTTARPYDYLKFSKTAANLGYHVISLGYENMRSINYIACGQTLDTTCHRRARYELWFGEDTHENIEVDYNNSIINRLSKLLEYLIQNYPEENWQQYLIQDNIDWEKITVAGHSQGGGHAGFASKHFKVDRVIMFAASDWVDGQTADWIRNSGPTPDKSYFGFIHQQDMPAYNVVIPAWGDYGILNFGTPVNVDHSEPPFNNSHGLITNLPVPDSIRPHNFIIVDIATPNASDYENYLYSEVWQYLLTADVSTSVLEINSNENNLIIYPNPASTFININCDEGFQIIDLKGKVVIECSELRDKVCINTLPSGVYFVKTEEKTGKFIKY